MSSLIAVSLKQVTHFARAQHSGADFIELRTDYFSLPQIIRLAERSTLPIILTIKRAVILPPRLPRTVRYIDLDYQIAAAQRRSIPRGPKLILSFHDYSTTPSFARLNRLVKQALAYGTLPKIATHIRSLDDLATIAQLQKTYGKKIIAIGMGELGLMTRLYNKSYLTFAALTARSTTAPGQVTVAQLRSDMQLFGLIGSDIAHSLSPRLHNMWFKQHHLSHRYQLWQTDKLDAFMTVFNFFGLPGASVTMPYKKAVMPYCQTIDRHARAIGAVNTLVRRGQRLLGYNTDWLGVQRVLGKNLKQANVLILGSGGAAAAVAYAAKQSSAHTVQTLNRTQLPTEQTHFDIIVNATPVSDRLLVPARALKNKIVMDCIYGRPTVLLRTAQAQPAARRLDGRAMLDGQAKEQFYLWTNQRP